MPNSHANLIQRAHESYATGSYTEEFHAASTRVNTLMDLLERAEFALLIARDMAVITGEFRPVIEAAAVRDGRAADVLAAISVMERA